MVQGAVDLAPELLALVRRTFGHDGLRLGQGEAASALLAGRDVQVLLPTGGGKSLCYQAAALALRARGAGPTLVISPLIALMDDQVAALRGRGVRAAAIHSGLDELVERAAVGDLLSGRLDLVYASPERVVQGGFRGLLARARVALLAVDEAHCISQWGHDFRPEYMRLGELRNELGVPTVALTATATPRVMDEIATSLGLRQPLVVRGGFRRPNLRFLARELGGVDARLEVLLEALERAGVRGGRGRALVYCATRKRVERVASELSSRGFPVSHYHAGRSDTARARAQRAYDLGRTPVLVATNAFGMGIDHGDVRLIVHFDMPGSLEAYYQEAGRAGRDGDPAECLLLHGKSDLVTQHLLARGASRSGHREALIAAVDAWARACECRQIGIARYFGSAETDPCGRCDVCTGDALVEPVAAPPARSAPTVRALDRPELDVIIEAARLLRRPVGKAALARALRGSRAKALRRSGLLDTPVHGRLRSLSEADVVAAIEQLLARGELAPKGRKYPTVWLAGRPVRSTEPRPDTTHRKPRRSPLWRALDTFRRRAARKLGWKVYMVFSRGVVDAIDAARPDSLWALGELPGIGPSKLDRFGAEVLALVKEHDGDTR